MDKIECLVELMEKAASSINMLDSEDVTELENLQKVPFELNKLPS